MTALHIAGLSLLLTLTACSTAVEPPLSYYRLDESATAISAPVDARTLVIDRVGVADFLRQTGMVLQLGSNELQISRQHRWAEGLEEALPRALQHQLQSKTQDYRVLLSGTDFIANTDTSLRIQIDSFHLLDNGEALLSGQYQLIDDDARAELKADSFRLVADLQQDGYPHAVQQLQGLLGQLASRIAEQLPR